MIILERLYNHYGCGTEGRSLQELYRILRRVARSYIFRAMRARVLCFGGTATSDFETSDPKINDEGTSESKISFEGSRYCLFTQKIALRDLGTNDAGGLGTSHLLKISTMDSGYCEPH